MIDLATWFQRIQSADSLEIINLKNFNPNLKIFLHDVAPLQHNEFLFSGYWNFDGVYSNESIETQYYLKGL